jgi:hypothetical protein
MAPCVVVGELIVIQAEEVENGAVDVANVVDTVNGFCADFIGGPDRVSGFRPTASKPHSHSVGVVIAAIA